MKETTESMTNDSFISSHSQKKLIERKEKKKIISNQNGQEQKTK